MAAVRGGEKMTRVLNAIANKVAKGKHVDVGFFADKKYGATVHKPKQGGMPVAQVAFWNEFGTIRSPPRPFFRQMISKNSAGWPIKLGKALKMYDYDADKALALLGVTMTIQLQDSIEAGDFAPLSPTTLRLRKLEDDEPNLVISRAVVARAYAEARAGAPLASGDRARPLLDGLVMIQSVGFKVSGR